MSSKDDGGPAFAHGNREQGGHPGMSLRDWLAGQALAGLIVAAPARGYALVAQDAYQHADAMLKERALCRERDDE